MKENADSNKHLLRVGEDSRPDPRQGINALLSAVMPEPFSRRSHGAVFNRVAASLESVWP